MYKVLWLDDEYEHRDMIQFAIEAKRDYELLLIGFRSYEEAEAELERNLKRYDIILLDGLFFEKQNQVKGSEDEKGIGMAIAKINELKSQKVFPWFVFSGKRSFTKEENSLLIANKAMCFDKKNIDDHSRLLKAMKNAAVEQLNGQLKYWYKPILELCEEKYLGEDNFSRLFSVIKNIESKERISNTEDLLNPLRKIVETIFKSLGKKGLIPDQILSGEGWINKSSLFLSNIHSEYEQISELIPPIIGENFHRLLNITHDASHAGGNLRLKSDQYIQSANSDYLYRSCSYLLLDILLWFKEFVVSHPDREQNLKLWRKRELPEGIIEKDQSGNYFCGEHLLFKAHVEKNNKIGDVIVITESIDNNRSSNNKYPKFATKYRKK